MTTLHDVTITYFGEDVEAVAECDTEYQRADPSVGLGESMEVHLVRLAIPSRGEVVCIRWMDPAERRRIESVVAGREIESVGFYGERRQAAAEDAWDAKRHGD